MINDFESFNEEFLGIDLGKIKKAAFDYHQTQECLLTFSKIEGSMLSKCSDELSKLRGKYGTIDNLIKKMLSKTSLQNEEIAIGYFILSAFGVHSIIKLLNRIRKKQGFGKFMTSLIATMEYDGGGWEINIQKSIRDLLISLTFLLYCLVYMDRSSIKTDCIYKVVDTDSKYKGMYINLPFKWYGLNDLYISDDAGKKYEFRKVGSGEFDIYLKSDTLGDKKIGTYNLGSGKIFNLSGKEILVFQDHDSVKFNGHLKHMWANFERLMTSESLSVGKDIKESLVKENVDQAKKILAYWKIDYDLIDTRNDVYNNYRNLTSLNKDRVLVFVETKQKLINDNSIGYLGLFTKLIFNLIHTEAHIQHRVDWIYQKIKDNRNVLNRLRDSSDNLKNIMSFNSFDELAMLFEDWMLGNPLINL